MITSNPYIRLLLLIVVLLVSAGTLQAQVITFSFANGSFSADGSRYEFDVMAASSTGEFFGDSQVYLNYSPDGFGENIAGRAGVTEGTLLQGVTLDGHSLVNVIDNAPNVLAITTEFLFESQSNLDAVSTRLSDEPQQLVRVSLPIADPSQTAGLSFNLARMQNQQFTAEGPVYKATESHNTDDTPLDSALPIELSSFTANSEDAAVVLDWTTASETDNAGFEIQQQLAPVEGGEARWETLAFVEGAGTTTEARTYRYRLETDALGQQQFRLKQLDFDGQFSYSEAVEVEVELATAYRLSDAYPNPFNPQTTVLLAVREAQEVTLEVFDMLGRRVSVLHRGTLEANRNHSFVWQASGHPSGVYFIRTVGAEFVETRQVTLVK